MTTKEQDIYQNLKTIFCDVFDDDSINPTPIMTANEVEGWDSLGHIRLVVAVEAKFGIKFTAMEINSWPNVGALVATINKKLA